MAESMAQERPSELRAGFFNPDVFTRKARMIKVLETFVAGVCYCFNLDAPEDRAFIESLAPGTELLLVRDTDNVHDRWAVSVLTTDRRELGYMTRFKNETVARLMDEGKVFRAFVDEKREIPRDPVLLRRTHAPTEGFEIPFSVYMED